MIIHTECLVCSLSRISHKLICSPYCVLHGIISLYHSYCTINCSCYSASTYSASCCLNSAFWIPF
nr:MAG TPA: hypothetical protein [Bacteriophage sp.]DAU52515.1 MAG TPA: hypothetical protein [Crassvirales sp.]DAV76848.1 MAG TPA: hypothetical protein [Caudoviricetes sp.]